MTATFDPAPAAGIDLTGTYTIDAAHSRIGWQARHAMVTNVRGNFSDFEGTFVINEADPSASSASLTIQTGSVSSSQEQRDGHIKSPDFFDVETHPTITFASTSIVKHDDEEYAVTGDLTIKGVSHPVTIDLTYSGAAKDPFGNTRIGFEGKAAISRKEWDLTWNAALETGGVLVSDKVKLDFDISLIKSA